jgi:predicted nucleic acid-binding protein
LIVIADTSILVDHLRGDDRAGHVLSQALERGDRLAASVLSKVEVLAGMRDEEEVPTRSLFSSLDWVPVDDPIAEQAGAFARRYLRSHPGVDPVDFVVAATAHVLEARLITRNRKHFPMFDLADPYQ